MGHKRPVICVDPGHGGFDGGGWGFGGRREEQSNMAIGVAAVMALRSGGYEARLSHTIPASLSARNKTARRMGADLVISIHSNAFYINGDRSRPLPWPRGSQNFVWPGNVLALKTALSIHAAMPERLRAGISRVVTAEKSKAWAHRARKVIAAYDATCVLVEAYTASNPTDMEYCHTDLGISGIVAAIVVGAARAWDVGVD